MTRFWSLLRCRKKRRLSLDPGLVHNCNRLFRRWILDHVIPDVDRMFLRPFLSCWTPGLSFPSAGDHLDLCLSAIFESLSSVSAVQLFGSPYRLLPSALLGFPRISSDSLHSQTLRAQQSDILYPRPSLLTLYFPLSALAFYILPFSTICGKHSAHSRTYSKKCIQAYFLNRRYVSV